jgi:hypothetical protein
VPDEQALEPRTPHRVVAVEDLDPGDLQQLDDGVPQRLAVVARRVDGQGADPEWQWGFLPVGGPEREW